MATSKTFKVAGITAHGDSIKVRFTDDMVRRIKQFTKGGASRIDLVELPNMMTKIEALQYLQKHADFQSPGDQATLADCLADKEKESKKGTVKVKVPKAKAAKVTKPSIEAIKARAKKKPQPTVEEVLAAVAEETPAE